MADYTETILVEGGSHESHAKAEPELLGPNTTMVFLTWLSFFLLLAVLYKYAWKPILAGLDAREAAIRKSVDEADRIKRELEEIHTSKERILNEAYAKAKEIVDESRKGAVEAARIIQQKAKDEAQILVENATREIKAETEKARVELRQECADLAVNLSAKLIHSNLDEEKSRRLVSQYIKEI